MIASWSGNHKLLSKGNTNGIQISVPELIMTFRALTAYCEFCWLLLIHGWQILQSTSDNQRHFLQLCIPVVSLFCGQFGCAEQLCREEAAGTSWQPAWVRCDITWVRCDITWVRSDITCPTPRRGWGQFLWKQMLKCCRYPEGLRAKWSHFVTPWVQSGISNPLTTREAPRTIQLRCISLQEQKWEREGLKLWSWQGNLEVGDI